MIRSILEETILFALPFFGFALWLAFRARAPFHWAHWEDRIGRLAFIGLVLAAAGFVAEGVMAKRNQGVYVPAHMDNGQLIPGGFR
jgi:hypothetical protein